MTIYEANEILYRLDKKSTLIIAIRIYLVDY